MVNIFDSKSDKNSKGAFILSILSILSILFLLLSFIFAFFLFHTIGLMFYFMSIVSVIIGFILLDSYRKANLVKENKSKLRITKILLFSSLVIIYLIFISVIFGFFDIIVDENLTNINYKISP